MDLIATYELALANKRRGGHWFDKSTMRSFSSRVSELAYLSEDGELAYFVSSEKFRGFRCGDGPRLYTVRCCRIADGDVEEIGEFQQYKSRSGADKAARRHAEKKTVPQRFIKVQ